MNTKNTLPKTLLEAVKHYADPDVCHAYMVSMKWPTGKITCPSCGGDSIGEIKSRRMFQCKNKDCRKQFSSKVNTIFEDSPLGLDKWFVAVWMIANCKNGVSSCELARTIGVTQKSAWHMLHRVRLAMQTKSFQKISGEVEADESFIGGRAANMHKSRRPIGRGFVGKAIVMGLLERNTEGGSRVKTAIIPDTKTRTIDTEVRKHVEPGSAIYTDSLGSYQKLAYGYAHEFINHAECYARGKVHTNGMENFWSLLKRGLHGTYVSVNAKHLTRYLDEQAFRFNERKGVDATRFNWLMRDTVGRRLTYRELTA